MAQTQKPHYLLPVTKPRQNPLLRFETRGVPPCKPQTLTLPPHKNQGLFFHPTPPRTTTFSCNKSLCAEGNTALPRSPQAEPALQPGATCASPACPAQRLMAPSTARRQGGKERGGQRAGKRARRRRKTLRRCPEGGVGLGKGVLLFTAHKNTFRHNSCLFIIIITI